MKNPYPMMMNLADRRVVVVGGGAVGRRKADRLLAAGARVRGVDPAGPDWPDGVEAVAAPYRREHLDGAVLAFACTDDGDVNARVAADAKAEGIFVNVADDPGACDFTTPAVCRTGAATVAVATAAGVPALAAALRDRLAEALPADLDAFAAALAAMRDSRMSQGPHAPTPQHWRRLCGPEGLAAFTRAGEPGLHALLTQMQTDEPT